ncbi:MAG: type IV secretory system conjugative DNA transfer family protein [Planctomycetes bacterium]|jgi:DNA polymerase III delta prime subunit|nr:type IV secretory system conjugative DNA transfer family protein [Planctomycetota bacterium]
MSDHALPAPIPDGWDFPLEFLEDPASLPPFVPMANSPVFGTSRRVRAADLLGILVPNIVRGTPEAMPFATFLAHTFAIVVDPKEKRHRLVSGCLQFSEELLNRHLLLVGPPGVGKTTQGMLPLIADLIAQTGRSVVVFDPKGDQFGVIRDLALQHGRSPRSIVRLNLTDPRGSIGWNPLRRGLERAEALAIATSLVMSQENKNGSDSPFWRNSSVELLVEIVLGLDGDPNESMTLPRVLEIVNLPRPALLTWLRNHGAHKFSTFLESGSHNAETCLADLGMRLLPLFDRDLCAVLSHAELDLDRLFKKPTVLIIEMSEARIDRLRPIQNLLVQQILDRAIAATEKRADARLPFPVSVVIDEFGSAIGAIPRFPIYLNTLRSRRVSIIAAVQGLSQIRALYGIDAGAVITGFSSKVFFPNAEHEDADHASLAAGTSTVTTPGPDGDSQWLGRRVFLPEEMMHPRRHPLLGRPVTMLLADARAFQIYLPPSYRLRELAPVLKKHSRRRLRTRRRHPLTYTKTAAGADSANEPTNLRNWSPEAIARHLDAIEALLGLAFATPEARQFWQTWRQSSGNRLAGVLRIAQQLQQLGATVQDYFDARRECGTDNPDVNVKYVDYLLARRRHDQRRRDAQ